MTRILYALVLATLFSLASPARAFTPESGWWWNPAEGGYGFSLEIQDDFIFLVAFAYDADGFPTWYGAQGRMVDNGLFQAPLYQRENGTCLGCPYIQPDPAFGVGENIRIEFTSEATANLTWAGRTIPVRRHDFYLSRNPNVDPKTELWLGEWQIVMDFINVEGAENYPFFGEVLVFDVLDTGSTPDFVDGCRPEDSQVGLCDDFALDNHDASVFYSPADGTNFIVVNDEPASGSFPGTWLVFEVEVGLYQFDGYAKRCPKTIPTAQLISNCLDNANHPVIPVRGWRSASRAFIEGNDNAPNAQPNAPKARRSGVTRRAWAEFPLTIGDGTPKAQPRARADAAGTAAKLQAALERMQAR